MEIKLKLREALAANIGFSLCNAVKDDSTRWNIAKNRRILAKEAEAYEEVRVQMIKDLSPENLDISKEDAKKQEEFRVRTKALLDKEVSCSGLLTIVKSLVLVEGVNLDAIDAIFPFIVE